MEHAGAEDMGDDVERKGLGTPATRADVIEKLVRGSIEDMVNRLVQTYHSISEEQKTMFRSSTQEVLGKCPKCGSDVVKGKFGA